MDEAIEEGVLHTLAVDPGEFAKCTPPELRTYFDDLLHLEKRGYISRHRKPRLASAGIDLDEYASIDDFTAQCRKIHKAHAVRKAIKAANLGYYGKFFDFRSHVPDIVAINKSTPARQGRAMTAHYTRTVDSYGGYPKHIKPEQVPGQAASWVRLFGVFRKIAGHRQGDVVSDEQLLAYISLQRHGNFATYSIILGHAEHLADGIMYKMHLDLAGAILAARDRAGAEMEPSLRCLKGIRYLIYSAYYDIRPGLLLWKKRTLFEPLYLKFDYLAGSHADQVCVAAEEDIGNIGWQAQCARMLAEIAQRCLDGGQADEAAAARAGLAKISKRLAARAREVSGADDSAAERDDDHGRVVVVGPTRLWSEVSPEGSLNRAEGAPALTFPPTGTITGRSPLLRCEFPEQDNGEPVDIVIQVEADQGNINFRLKLGWLRHVDLDRLGVALPPGEAKAWAVHRSAPGGSWATARRVDFRIDPDAANATDMT